MGQLQWTAKVYAEVNDYQVRTVTQSLSIFKGDNAAALRVRQSQVISLLSLIFSFIYLFLQGSSIAVLGSISRFLKIQHDLGNNTGGSKQRESTARPLSINSNTRVFYSGVTSIPLRIHDSNRNREDGRYEYN